MVALNDIVILTREKLLGGYLLTQQNNFRSVSSSPCVQAVGAEVALVGSAGLSSAEDGLRRFEVRLVIIVRCTCRGRREALSTCLADTVDEPQRRPFLSYFLAV